jgi:hypothetical protein
LHIKEKEREALLEKRKSFAEEVNQVKKIKNLIRRFKNVWFIVLYSESKSLISR